MVGAIKRKDFAKPGFADGCEKTGIGYRDPPFLGAL